MNNSYYYAGAYVYSSLMQVILPLLLTAAVIGGGLALYFLFVRRPNTFQGAAAWLHDALSFRTFFSEHLLRALYAIAVVALALSSLLLLFTNTFGAILLFVTGNIVMRIAFELLMLLFSLGRGARQDSRRSLPPSEELEEEPEDGDIPILPWDDAL